MAAVLASRVQGAGARTPVRVLVWTVRPSVEILVGTTVEAVVEAPIAALIVTARVALGAAPAAFPAADRLEHSVEGLAEALAEALAGSIGSEAPFDDLEGVGVQVFAEALNVALYEVPRAAQAVALI